MYNPLPKCVTIKESPIHGLGLFATSFIPRGMNLGVTHYAIPGVTLLGDSILRTPLGGFYNHSDDPNCEKVLLGCDGDDSKTFYLVSSRDIDAGEELTVRYTFYKP